MDQDLLDAKAGNDFPGLRTEGQEIQTLRQEEGMSEMLKTLKSLEEVMKITSQGAFPNLSGGQEPSPDGLLPGVGLGLKAALFLPLPSCLCATYPPPPPRDHPRPVDAGESPPWARVPPPPHTLHTAVSSCPGNPPKCKE